MKWKHIIDIDEHMDRFSLHDEMEGVKLCLKKGEGKILASLKPKERVAWLKNKVKQTKKEMN